jgi:Ca2+-binding EF-hand superfamily protein
MMQLYDINNDDKITLEEVEEIARAIYALLGYYVSPPYDRQTSDDRARQLFSKLDPYNKSFVTKDDFIRLCSRVCDLFRRPFATA